MKKDIESKLTDLPNENYRKLFEKFKNIETLEVKDWKVNEILGYFCKKYQETYNVNYKFKFNTPAPSKCFEVFQVKRLASNLTSDPVILKDYIDWVYKNKVVKAKRRLTSISFMTVEGIMNEYKFNVLLNSKNNNNTISRSTPLPDKYKDIFKDMETYGDLAFLIQSKLTDEQTESFNKAKELGLDISILSKVI